MAVIRTMFRVVAVLATAVATVQGENLCSSAPQKFTGVRPFWKYFSVEFEPAGVANYVDVQLSVDGMKNGSSMPILQLGSYVNYGPMKYCTIACRQIDSCNGTYFRHSIMAGDPCFAIVQHFQFNVIVQSALNYTATYTFAANMTQPFTDTCSSKEPPDAVGIMIGCIIGAIVLAGCVGFCCVWKNGGSYSSSGYSTNSTFSTSATAPLVPHYERTAAYQCGGTTYNSFNAMRDANPRSYTSGFSV